MSCVEVDFGADVDVIFVVDVDEENDVILLLMLVSMLVFVSSLC